MNGISSAERKAKKNHAILAALGKEPVWDSKKTESQLSFMLNWYSQNKDTTAGQKWFVAYFKNKPQEELALISKLQPWQIGTSGYLARMCLLSPDVSADIVERLEKKYDQLLTIIDQEKVNENVDKKKKVTLSIQDRVQAQIQEYQSNVDGWLDDFLENKLKSNINPFEYYQQKQIKSPQIKYIAEYYQETLLSELKETLSGKDDQLVEAYSFLSKSELKKFAKFLELIIDDANKWYDISKEILTSNKKIRVKKEKPAINQIAKLQYMKNHEDLKSVNPTNIVGAQQLWVYNVKYRTLGVYVSNSPHGFSVKGCTILNYDEATSLAKKIRKPEEIISKVMTVGKVALRKILPDIKAKEQKLTGRINKDTILLKVA